MLWLPSFYLANFHKLFRNEHKQLCCVAKKRQLQLPKKKSTTVKPPQNHHMPHVSHSTRNLLGTRRTPDSSQARNTSSDGDPTIILTTDAMQMHFGGGNMYRLGKDQHQQSGASFWGVELTDVPNLQYMQPLNAEEGHCACRVIDQTGSGKVDGVSQLSKVMPLRNSVSEDTFKRYVIEPTWEEFRESGLPISTSAAVFLGMAAPTTQTRREIRSTVQQRGLRLAEDCREQKVKINRNARCPCESGRKYKKCCGK